MPTIDVLITTLQSLIISDSGKVCVRCQSKLGYLHNGKIICDARTFTSLNEFGVFAYGSKYTSISSVQYDLITFECDNYRVTYSDVKQKVTLQRGRASENLKLIEQYIKEYSATMKDRHKELQNAEDSDSDTDEEHDDKHPLIRTGTGHETLRHRKQQHNRLVENNTNNEPLHSNMNTQQKHNKQTP